GVDGAGDTVVARRGMTADAGGAHVRRTDVAVVATRNVRERFAPDRGKARRPRTRIPVVGARVWTLEVALRTTAVAVVLVLVVARLTRVDGRVAAAVAGLRIGENVGRRDDDRARANDHRAVGSRDGVRLAAQHTRAEDLDAAGDEVGTSRRIERVDRPGDGDRAEGAQLDGPAGVVRGRPEHAAGIHHQVARR